MISYLILLKLRLPTLRISLLIAFLISVSFQAISQTKNSLRLGAGFETTLIKKKLDFAFEGGARTKSGYVGFNKYLIEPSLNYKINKKLNTKVEYRYTQLLNSRENRLSIGLKWSDKIIKRTYLGFKVKYQTEKGLSDRFWEKIIRTKWDIKYKIKKTKLYPYFYNEWFLGLNPSYYGFENTRIGCGLNIKSLKNQTIKIGYFLGLKLNNGFNSKRNILNISYNIKL